MRVERHHHNLATSGILRFAIVTGWLAGHSALRNQQLNRRFENGWRHVQPVTWYYGVMVIHLSRPLAKSGHKRHQICEGEHSK